MGLQGVGYKIDIAFVIDATGSMTPIMDQAKERALTMGDEIINQMKAAGKPCDQLRMRVIDFADFSSEGEDAIRATEFYTIPAQKADFENAVRSIDIEGRGGDDPENGLEALYSAMMSEWVQPKPGEKARHIIVIITDQVPLNLHERDGCVGYDSDSYPSNIEELENIWNEEDNSQEKMTKLRKAAKRIVLFAPETTDANGHSWAAVRGWKLVTAKAVDAATGLEGISLDAIIAEIVRSTT